MRSNDEIMDIVEQLTNEKGMSISELAREVDIAKSSVSRYFSRSRGFPLNRVDDFARALGTTSEYILGFEDNRGKLISIYEKLQQPRKEKVYNFAEEQLNEQEQSRIEEKQKVLFPSNYNNEREFEAYPFSAGPGEWMENVATQTVTYKGDVPPHDYVGIVNGQSMGPAFEDNEILFIKKAVEARNGQFVVARINGSGFLKKYVVENGTPKLVSLNKDYDDVEINEYDRFEIIGIVEL